MSAEVTEKTGGVLDPTAAHPSQPSPPPNCYYGTFQGVANYQPQPAPPSHHVMGFPQPVPPPGVSDHPPVYYPHGYQTSPAMGYVVIPGRPFREHRLPCCGLGLGWLLFISGCFMGAIPWYIGAFLLACVRMDYREKPGLIGCTIAAVLATFAVTLGVTRLTHSW